MAFSPDVLLTSQEPRTCRPCSRRAFCRSPCTLCPWPSWRRGSALRRSQGILRGGTSFSSSESALCRASCGNLRLPEPYSIPHYLAVAFLALEAQRSLLGGLGRPDQLRELLASVAT